MNTPDYSDPIGNAISEVIFMDKNRPLGAAADPEIPQLTPDKIQRPIPARIYPVIDNDLARDNIENDIPAADLEEL